MKNSKLFQTIPAEEEEVKPSYLQEEQQYW